MRKGSTAEPEAQIRRRTAQLQDLRNVIRRRHRNRAGRIQSALSSSLKLCAVGIVCGFAAAQCGKAVPFREPYRIAERLCLGRSLVEAKPLLESENFADGKAQPFRTVRRQSRSAARRRDRTPPSTSVSLRRRCLSAK